MQQGRKVLVTDAVAAGREPFIAVYVAYEQEEPDADSVLLAHLGYGLPSETDGDAETGKQQEKVAVLEQYIRELHRC